MNEQTPDTDSFARIPQTAYHEVHLHGPQTVQDSGQRLQTKLESDGIVLTADILRALAFAAVKRLRSLTRSPPPPNTHPPSAGTKSAAMPQDSNSIRP
ncbi:hypothetical protein [Nocardia vaccinii]|uniref:hypothetical protein n=1 Tax=Nocardia vaccinii TaxID=1822 RepID=UPI00082DF8D5|nr:hypothetical protein [Nocardia vaccinii]